MANVVPDWKPVWVWLVKCCWKLLVVLRETRKLVYEVISFNPSHHRTIFFPRLISFHTSSRSLELLIFTTVEPWRYPTSKFNFADIKKLTKEPNIRVGFPYVYGHDQPYTVQRETQTHSRRCNIVHGANDRKKCIVEHRSSSKYLHDCSCLQGLVQVVVVCRERSGSLTLSLSSH